MVWKRGCRRGSVQRMPVGSIETDRQPLGARLVGGERFVRRLQG
jgi:hypothetical protein